VSDHDYDTDESAKGSDLDLVAPRRIFKRKKRSGLLLVLKIGLPLVAVICVAYIVIWSRFQLPNITINPVQATSNAAKPSTDVTVNRVKYDGVDVRNRPFTITADSATQPDNTPVKDAGAPVPADPAVASQPQSQIPATPKTDSVINLTKPEADMTMQDGAWVDVKADSGVYNRDLGTVDLNGNVQLFHDTGLQFETDAATVDLKNNTAQGDQPVEGQNADGTLAAEGFQVLNDGRMVIFTGRAYMKIFPKSQGSSQGTSGGASE
jgi:lipopolysaccharide export system protein LptC